MDGTLLYNGNKYRQGELITVDYDSVKDKSVFNVVYEPFSGRRGDFELDFTITDRKGVSHTKNKALKIY
ncbi:hypothetical protein AAKU52_002578 [Pedobacter sp. CG_S7]|uniref:hypothetical protein n=1 Tax=Pedobacter sp. CG_S7 TaxID=3143930 RepID=UPI00339A1B03